MATERKYRHGDVEGAALRAARTLVETDGVSALSVRGIARAIGVSHAALYRHFADREALLAALGTEALTQLAREQAAARARHADPAAAVAAVARAYFRFALREPALYRAAFVVSNKAEHPALRAAADAAEAPALAALRELAEAGQLVASDIPRLAAILWALLHGFSTLAIDGQLTEGTIALGRGAAATIERALLEVVRRILADSPTR
ncbi:MAG: TetR/AcrR family transcriptional regulator [Gemmatimonadaceae bacterium]|nr:TetR/AcrR family transcriptional regulator [Gemmatimonadaceae bacterium]